MTTRLLDCVASEFALMTRDELIRSITASEGRTLVSESIVNLAPTITNVSNPEIAAALGADILLLNYFDLDNPHVEGLPPHRPDETIKLVKRLTGRPVGINLEPGCVDSADSSKWNAMRKGYLFTGENAAKATDMGVDFILITGNPKHGVNNGGIVAALDEVRRRVGDRVIIGAGKMHASGVLSEASNRIMRIEDVHAFSKAGADVILLPAPGTVPGVTLGWAQKIVEEIHRTGKLAMTSVGTSQEGSDTGTIRAIALMAKQSGADIHHIGDTGYIGIALPENIMAYSIAIRGVQHTYRRMALSINR